MRLASEIFQRCVALLKSAGADGPYTLYDPCCGGAQLLTTLTYLHGECLTRVLGSDIDPEAVKLAGRNLALLTLPGLDTRISALTSLRERYGKASHVEALAHAATLRHRLLAITERRPIAAGAFIADATQAFSLLPHLAAGAVDLIITDVPYGRQSAWQTGGMPMDPVMRPTSRLLEALQPTLATPSVVAIAANRQQKIAHPGYHRAAQLQIGKRHVAFFTAESPEGN